MNSLRLSILAAAVALLSSASPAIAGKAEDVVALDPAHMPVLGTVDEKYQSYNIEMIQVMGGDWWGPYAKKDVAHAPGTSGGFANAPMHYRPPADLADPRLRTLAAALSPAYVRVSDAWANTVYFQDDDGPATAPPPGFRAVITRRQWQGVIDYANALDAGIVTSFSIGTGVRDANGVWTPSEAQKLLSFFGRSGGTIAAAEFFNEPNLGVVSGTPKNYDAASYARDFRVFRSFIQAHAPQIKLMGPGPVGEDRPLPGLPKGIATEDILQATGPSLDAVSYHFYGAVSQRCAAFGPGFQTTPAAALSAEWLSATNKLAAFYSALRDRYEPGKPVWLSETAEAACGGNPWAATFIDSFRYLNQLGTLAKQGVQVVMHNTLAGSDYGLIDDVTLAPRPNYWSAVLWRRLMGRTVLGATDASAPNLYLYAHCLRDRSGGVALLAINADRASSRQLAVPVKSMRLTLTAAELLDTNVDLNGAALKLRNDGTLPQLKGVATGAGILTLAPASISFLEMKDAGNVGCVPGQGAAVLRGARERSRSWATPARPDGA